METTILVEKLCAIELALENRDDPVAIRSLVVEAEEQVLQVQRYLSDVQAEADLLRSYISTNRHFPARNWNRRGSRPSAAGRAPGSSGRIALRIQHSGGGNFRQRFEAGLPRCTETVKLHWRPVPGASAIPRRLRGSDDTEGMDLARRATHGVAVACSYLTCPLLILAVGQRRHLEQCIGLLRPVGNGDSPAVLRTLEVVIIEARAGVAD
jgi:hypothetical protein